jgi:hypothetical protein
MRYLGIIVMALTLGTADQAVGPARAVMVKLAMTVTG